MPRPSILVAFVLLMCIPLILYWGYRSHAKLEWRLTQAECIQSVQLDRGQSGWWICYETPEGCEEGLIFPPKDVSLWAGSRINIQYARQGSGCLVQWP